MENKNIFILGVGNNTPVYIDLAESCGYVVSGLFHYNEKRTGEQICGIPILDSSESLFQKESLEAMQFAISVGDNQIRARISERIREKGGYIPNLVHPSAVVSKYAEIAEGVVVHSNSVVQAGASIAQDTVISYNASVSHTSTIGKACYVAFGSTIGAYVHIGDYVLVGQAAILISGKVENVGENSVIGAGSVVTRSLEANTTVRGNPAISINVSNQTQK